MSYRFSVILPVYNKAPYIAKAIRSVLSQTCQDFELIVVDDGSKDESATIAEDLLRQCDEPKCRLIRQPNAGVSTARNNGVAASQGEYLCFLDADDWWETTFLEEMQRLITAFPNAGIYGTSYTIVNETKRKTRIAPIGVESGFVKGEINYCQVYAKTLCMPLWTGAVCMPKAVFDQENGFKPTLKLGEDFDLWIRVALKHKVVFLNQPLAYYNQDVEVTHRGVVDDKIYHPSTHFIFNLDYLSQQEINNKTLKTLLDRLRVYTLFRYHLQKAHIKEYKRELNKVDFSNQPLSVRLQYALPIWTIKLLIELKRTISNIIK